MTYRRLLAGLIAAACLSPAVVHAAPPPNISGSVAMCDPNAPSHCAAPNSSGQILTFAPPYVYTSIGFQQVSVTSSAAVTVVPGAGATVCFIVVETNPVRYRTDGVAPTTSVGMPLAIYSLTGGGGPMLTLTATGAQFIATTGTATLDVDCDR